MITLMIVLGYLDNFETVITFNAETIVWWKWSCKYVSKLIPYYSINVTRRTHVLVTIFCSSLPPVVCRKAHVLVTIFCSSLPPVVCRRAHVLVTMFGSSLPPVVCRRVHVLVTITKTWALLQTTGGKDEPNIVTKTWALLQTTGGKDEPNIVTKTWARSCFRYDVWFVFTSSCL
jgi:hypothetical protein